MSATSARRRSRSRGVALPQRVPASLWSLLALLASVALLGTCLAGVFKVRRVDVVGAGLPRAQIVAASGVSDTNIFGVQTDAVIQRVSTIRTIAVRKVTVSFPDTVTIYARARIAMAAWRQGKTLYLLDPDGRIIRQVTKTTLPVITSSTTGGALGSGVVIGVREAMKMMGKQIASFQYNPQTGLSIVGRAGWRAIIGRGSPQKLVRRDAILVAFLWRTRGNPQRLQLVDLRYSTPYARYAP